MKSRQYFNKEGNTIFILEWFGNVVRKVQKEHYSSLSENKVKSLYVFGSILTDRFTDKSDIDLIVDIDSIDPLDYADNLFNLKFALEELLNRQIDLLENKAIKNPYFRDNIDSSKILLYAS